MGICSYYQQIGEINNEIIFEFYNPVLQQLMQVVNEDQYTQMVVYKPCTYTLTHYF